MPTPRPEPYSTPSAPGVVLRPKAWRLILALVIGGTLLGWLGLRFLKPAYHQRRAASYAALATRHLDARDLPAADLALSNALRHDPARPDTWRIYARFLQARGDARYAVAEAQLAELTPTDEAQAVRALEACLATGNVPLARHLSDLFTPRFPNNAALRHGAAVSLLRAQQPGAARAALDTALKLNSTNASYRLSDAALRLTTSSNDQDAARAIIDLEELRVQPALRASASASLARYFASRDPARAEQLWDDVSTARPDFWEARLARWEIARVRRPDHAAGELEKLWPLATNLTQRLHLVDAALRSAGPENALTYLDRLPVQERNQPPSVLAWLDISARLNDWAQVNSLIAAHVNDPGLSLGDQILLALWQVRGSASQSQPGGGDSALDRAVNLADGNPALALPAGELLLSWNLPQAAERFFATAAAAPDDATATAALRQLIAAAESGCNPVAGLAAAQQLLKKSPSDPLGRQSVAWYLLVANTGLDRARAMLEDLARHSTSPAGMEEPLALLAWRRGNADEAVTRYTTLAQGPRNHNSRVFFAASLAAVGRTNDARRLLGTVNPDRLYPSTRDEHAALAQRIGATPAP